MTGNELLAAKMAAAGLRQHELAQALNDEIGTLTGRPGTLQDRHVRNWLTGKTRWPQERQRRALEAVIGCTAQELGFIPPSRSTAPPSLPPEESVRRRTFAGNVVGLVAATALPPLPATSYRRIGMSDTERLRVAFADLVASDNVTGGTPSLETRAVAFAHHAMELQAVGSASQRVRARLYELAAAFTGTALWAAVDSCEPERAQRHLERAMTLAGLSGSAEITLRLWGHAGILARQTRQFNDAVAAATAARASAACRRDPLFRSLAHARLAGAYAGAKRPTDALRTLEHAIKAFDGADPHADRPVWMGFYDRAELHGLSALVHAGVGRHDEAEAHLHHTLSLLRPGFNRNRSYYRSHLALAQLRQGEAEQACTTALSVLPTQPGDSLTERTSRLLTEFTAGLNSAAPRARCTTEWMDQYRPRRPQ
ncbi:hypothetical protein F0344_17175 [Streptomyces finlayi]|uniref:XRE family transcriptional regulator n=1 Tax=Streptomyces finlayi TaxID=67296 RepID=A0A7G7BLA8_9ACTN|nr:hypothetical protein [Streptomyces finlayi]QNE76123.1 hypothetical protein F0344_17175 [Streptomyces finlayi]